MPNDFRTYVERKKGWWIEHRSTIDCIVSPDGQLVKFLRSQIEDFLDKTYPVGKNGRNKVWYFNATRDREIAECDYDVVCANPQVLLRHFLKQEEP